MTENQYDLIIAGTGPGGLSAAIYAQRQGMKTVVFGDTPGGSLYRVENLTNYPGFPNGVSGPDFGVALYTQARKEGAFLPMTRLNLLNHDGEQFMGIDADSRQYFSPTALIACGAAPKTLDVPNSDKKGIFYSSMTDGPSFQNKNATLAVIGGGNRAGQEALTLSKFAQRVILIHDGPELSAEAAIKKALERKKNIYVLLNTQVVYFMVQHEIEGVLVIVENEKKKIRVNGVFLALGWKANPDMLKIPVETSSEGFIKTDGRLMTSFPGLFAAGDIRDTDMRQVITSCADGARAAVYAYKYLEFSHHSKHQKEEKPCP